MISLKDLDPEFRSRFIEQIKGKDFVNYIGLRRLCDKEGIRSIQATVVQFPLPENGELAICEATLIDKDGNEWKDVGDCDNRNCKPHLAVHKVRMASTRAKGRAMRDFLGIDMTMYEEVVDVDNEAPDFTSDRAPIQVITREQLTQAVALIERKGLTTPAALNLFKEVTHKQDVSGGNVLASATFDEAVAYIQRLGSLPDVNQQDNVSQERVA